MIDDHLLMVPFDPERHAALDTEALDRHLEVELGHDVTVYRAGDLAPDDRWLVIRSAVELDEARVLELIDEWTPPEAPPTATEVLEATIARLEDRIAVLEAAQAPQPPQDADDGPGRSDEAPARPEVPGRPPGRP